MATVSADAQKRLARIGKLGQELCDKCAAESDETLARCKAIAIELVDLFLAEEIYRKYPDSTVTERARKAVEESRRARRTSSEATEVMALERQMLSTNRHELRTTSQQLIDTARQLKERLKKS